MRIKMFFVVALALAATVSASVAQGERAAQPTAQRAC